jgi:XRE family transcriptional regulator, aerobic/anaerobic benzoate catabolism transcriptional regulator
MRQVLGVRARLIRKMQKLTLKELSAKSGLSVRFIGEVEAGRANPSMESVLALAQALDVHIFSLFGHIENSESHSLLHVLIDLLPTGAAEMALHTLRGLIPNRARALVLLGLRGAGKSTLGPKLSAVLKRDFYEVDAEIEAEAGMDLASIFEFHGEAHYRELEHRVLERLLRDTRPCVLAVSGGVVTQSNSWALIRKEAITLWLKATPHIHWSRVVAQGDLRPISGRSRAPAELMELYHERQPIYSSADLVLDTSSMDASGVLTQATEKFNALVGDTPAGATLTA